MTLNRVSGGPSVDLTSTRALVIQVDLELNFLALFQPLALLDIASSEVQDTVISDLFAFLLSLLLHLPDSKFDLDFFQAEGFLSTTVHLSLFYPDLLRQCLWSFEPLVHCDIAVSLARAIELQGASVAKILSSHKLLLLRI